MTPEVHRMAVTIIAVLLLEVLLGLIYSGYLGRRGQ